ncbi:CBM35 domain-containing protein [Curtobacterium sp. RRHDQ10]|uniref:CBM35 domain-containing protein n=1 Tax=Curtobacterium phyllosphaerae TaxID=3413379 RepID=UPI003BF3E459
MTSVLALAAGLSGLAAATAGPAVASTVRYEAEQAALSGGATVATDHSGYSGTGFAGGFTDGNRGTAKVAFTVSVASAGTYDLQLGYADGTGSARTFTLTIDGSARQISLPATANWDTWGAQTTSAALGQGTHTISYSYGSSDSGNANLDFLAVTPESSSTTPPASSGSGSYEAESASLAGGAVVQTEHSGHTGSGYVGGYTDSARGAATTTFHVATSTAGSYALALRYANGTTTTRTLTLSVDGTARQVSLPVTADWNTWGTITTTVSLTAGTHAVAYSYGSADNGNANLDSLTVTAASTPPTSTPPAANGEGATVAYDEYPAATAQTNGTVIAPDRTYTTIAAESTGRSAVQLSTTGQYVRFTLRHAANSVVVRYSLPPNSDGSPRTATLSLYAGSSQVTDLNLTTKYSDLYGNGYDSDQHTPNGSPAHHFYDETRAMIGNQPAGTVITLQKDASDTASPYTIDLVDTEQVAAAGTMPSGYRSVTDFGVTPDSGADATSAISSALQQLQGTGTGLWFPSGTYRTSSPISYRGVAIKGAGMWWTTLQVSGTDQDGGLRPQGGTVSIADLTISGSQTHRDNSADAAGIEGVFGTGSTISNVWIEHTKVGIWTDQGTDGLRITGARIRDVWADGVHFNGGTANASVTQSVFRNLGDDAIAVDTETFTNGQTSVTGSVVDHDSIANVVQANGIGVYGGGDTTVSNNLVSDSVAFGSGITVSSRFGTSFTGPTTVSGNGLVRTGGSGPGYEDQIGGIWIVADKYELTQTVSVSGNVVLDSTFAGVKVSYPNRVDDLRLTGNTIDGAGTYGIQVRATSGLATVSSTTVTGAASGGLDNGNAGGFTVRDGGGNSGIAF